MKENHFINTIFIFLITILIIILSSCLQPVEEIPGGPGNPIIEFTYVPPYGSFKNLEGQVWHVKPSDYKVAVYIYVAGWWTKPYWDSPLTTIQSDGSWICDITTGGVDQNATKIAAFLFPNEYNNPPLMSGGAILPSELFQNSVTNIEVTRTAESTFRTLSFAGYKWKVKKSDTPVGPGPNYFSDSVGNVWLDNNGQLHLKITLIGGKWYCAEVISQNNFGYGKYIFYLSSRVDQLNENIVLGLFTWDDTPEYNHREIDIEFSKWGEQVNDNSQFVVQPWDIPGNMYRFNTQLNDNFSTHSFSWNNESIFFQSLHSNYATPPNNDYIVKEWNYTGNYVPITGNENARINLWLFNGSSPSDNNEVEVIINKFEFIP